MLPTTSSGEYSSSMPTEDAYLPSILPLGRQLPQPSNREAGPRGSFSTNQSYFKLPTGLHLGYPNEGHGPQRAFPETSQGSVASASQGAASTTSSQKEAQPVGFDYASIPQSPSQVTSANYGDYHTAATTIDTKSTILGTSAATSGRRQTGGHGHMRTVNPEHDYSDDNLNYRRASGGTKSEASIYDYPSYSMLQPQHGYLPPPRPTTHGTK
ncbi:MAG: hypothetical protein Q9163_000554 [Psora crenata]